LPLDVLILGPQGAGKGTQAKRIADEYGVPHVSTGDILRAAIAAGTPLGRQVEPIVESGALVPDELMVDLIRERLAAPDTTPGFVLDGFPRTLAQAEALDEMLGGIARAFTVVLALQVPDDVARERLLGRAAKEGRTDDTPEAIDRRLALYHELTAPVVEHYRAQGRFVPIHGERGESEVWAEIQDALETARAADSDEVPA
jgi:adenylate kinase